MTYISVHDAKQIRKRNNGKDTWISLFVVCHAIAVYNPLKGTGNLVRLKVRRWGLLSLDLLKDGAHLCTTSFLRLCDRRTNVRVGSYRGPANSHRGRTGKFQQIHGGKDGLFCNHGPTPVIDVR